MARLPSGVSTTAAALAKRLREGTPTAADLAELEIVKQIRRLLDGRSTHQQIADKLDWPRYRVSRFLATSVYRTYVQHLAEENIKASCEVESRAAHKQMADDRLRFAKLADPALTYLEESFKRDAKTGDCVDPGRAMWATNIVVKGRGLDTPEHGGRPLIQINIGTIQHGQSQIAADDRAHAARITVEGEAITLPALSPPGGADGRLAPAPAEPTGHEE